MPTDIYQEPLVSRYTSKAMQHIFSDDFKFQSWRKCWTALAEAEMELGLKDANGNPRITRAMIDELVAAQSTIDYGIANAEEKKRRHDVMAHVYEYGTHCPTAKGIIHLGATSMFVGDNTDLIQMREATAIIRKGLINVIYNLSEIADANKDLACLGYTHYQPAQPTTMGKRFTLYIQDLLMDLELINSLKFRARGAKGTTGTQASYMELFDGDYEKVKALDQLVSEKLGFDSSFDVTGQTYTRKFDTIVAGVMAGVAVSLKKFATDIRLLSNQKCVDEPFEVDQTGSSAMAYKRNPMRSERMTSLSRLVMSRINDYYGTAADQWFERTLDDSAIRRMVIPQTFLGTEAILILANNITNRNVNPETTRPMTFYHKRIARLLNDELQFSATEAILMDLAKQGYDRQAMHELIQTHSVASSNAMKEEGTDNTLFERLTADDKFPLDAEELDAYLIDPLRFTGAASQQTSEYLQQLVRPILEKNADLIGKSEGRVNV